MTSWNHCGFRCPDKERLMETQSITGSIIKIISSNPTSDREKVLDCFFCYTGPEATSNHIRGNVWEFESRISREFPHAASWVFMNNRRFLDMPTWSVSGDHNSESYCLFKRMLTKQYPTICMLESFLLERLKCGAKSRANLWDRSPLFFSCPAPYIPCYL